MDNSELCHKTKSDNGMSPNRNKDLRSTVQKSTASKEVLKVFVIYL